ncbi:MAG: TetR family transcriptional regulator, partial [Nitrospiraceae bacterium]|nr:TetR family transcriptional regulator [Nitrospiraceae bacterium]
LHKLSISNIAKKVGISDSTIFRHFKNKREILMEMISNVEDDLVVSLKKIAMQRTPAVERLHDYLCFHIKYLVRNKGITLLFFTEASYQNDELMKKKLDEIYNQTKHGFCKIILDGIAEEIWDSSISTENLAKLYMGIPLVLNIELTLNPNQFPEKDFCNKMVKLILAIMKPTEVS